MGDVVMTSPSSIDGWPRTVPITLPFGMIFHLSNVVTPSCVDDGDSDDDDDDDDGLILSNDTTPNPGEDDDDDDGIICTGFAADDAFRVVW